MELDNLDNFLGSKKSINSLKTQLDESNFSGFYYIYGKKGVGKSTIVNLLCRDNDISIINLDLSTKESRKTALCEMMKSSLVKRALLLDNIDLTNKVGKHKYKKFMDFIIKKQDKMKKNLVFMIGEKKKFIKTFGKLDMNTYMISRPRDNAILKLLKEEVIQDKIEMKEEELDLLLETYIKEKQGNLKSILVNIEFFLTNLEETSFEEEEDKEKHKEVLVKSKIDKDQELFSVIGGIFHNKNFSKRCDIYYNNTFMIPYFVHENYPNYIISKEKETTVKYNHFMKTTKDKERLTNGYKKRLIRESVRPYNKIATTMADFDLINEVKMKKQCFSLDPYLSAFSCGFTKSFLGNPDSQMITFPRKIKLAKKTNLLEVKGFGPIIDF